MRSRSVEETVGSGRPPLLALTTTVTVVPSVRFHRRQFGVQARPASSSLLPVNSAIAASTVR